MNIVDRLLAESHLCFWGLAAILFLLVEGVLQRGLPARSRITNLCNGVLVAVSAFCVSPVVSFAVTQVGTLVGIGLIDLRYFSNGYVLPEIAAATLYLFVYDFFYYWFHRAQHRYPVLWAAHSVHHSDEDYDSTTYLRQHVSEPLVQGLAVTVPVIVVFKFTPVTIWAIAFLASSWSFITHMSIRMQLGACSWLITAPQLHRLHHSRLPQHVDKNFAGYFPIWDIMFATFLGPTRDEFPPTGLASGERIESVGSMIMWPLRAYRPSWCAVFLGFRFRQWCSRIAWSGFRREQASTEAS